MDEVVVIREGHARKSGDVWYASSTVTVIRSGRKTMVVDPGCVRGLTELLEMHSVWPEDVGLLFISHGHADHFLNMGLFKDAVIMDGTYMYEDDRQTPLGMTVPGTGIGLVQTPGHTPDHASLTVRSDGLRYLIAGDLFWWEDVNPPPPDPRALMDLPDPTAYDMRLLLASREKALEGIDVVIPGHGRPVRLAGTCHWPNFPTSGTKMQ